MKCLYLYNPYSGNGKTTKYVDYIVGKLEAKFGEAEARASAYAGEMRAIAEEACGKYDVLLFAGGDGSFNEVLNGIAEQQTRPILGYIPTGTVNDIARSLGIPRGSVKKALKVFLRGEEQPLDVMKVNDAYAEYEVSAGILTSCSYKAPHKEKVRLGKLAYGVEILRHNMKFTEFCIKVEANGKTIDSACDFVIFLNSRSVASLPVHPEAELADGEVEMLLVKHAPQKAAPKKARGKIAALINVLSFFLFGYRNAKRSAVYEKIKSQSFTVHAPEDLVWNFDGEEGVKGDLELRVLPRHVSVVVPKRKPKHRRKNNGETGKARRS